jgi:hypothetical protein
MAEFIVVIDFRGVVGVFSSMDAVKQQLSSYNTIPMLFYSFPIVKDIQSKSVWVIPYTNDIVAFASNDKTLCSKIYERLYRLDLTYEVDSLDWWECTVDSVIESAVERLNIQNEAIKLKSDPDKLKDAIASSDKTFQKFLESYKKYTDDAEEFNIKTAVVTRLPYIDGTLELKGVFKPKPEVKTDEAKPAIVSGETAETKTDEMIGNIKVDDMPIIEGETTEAKTDETTEAKTDETKTDETTEAKTDETKTDETTEVKTAETTEVKTDETTEVKTDETAEVKTDDMPIIEAVPEPETL